LTCLIPPPLIPSSSQASQLTLSREAARRGSADNFRELSDAKRARADEHLPRQLRVPDDHFIRET